MQCVQPLTIKQKGNYVQVPCGKCGICLQRRRKSWQFRLMQELKYSWSAFFITLTYNEHSIVDLNKRDIQLFMKKLRNYENKVRSKDIENRKIKYYITGEYGSLGRPHYHGLVFSISKETRLNLDKIWNNGFVKVGTVNEASIMYVLKYMMDESNKFKPLISKGIGIDYLRKNEERLDRNPSKIVYSAGKANALPRYYVDKVYTEDQKRKLRAESSIWMDKSWKKKYDDLSRYSNEPYRLRQLELENKSKIIIENSHKNKKL